MAMQFFINETIPSSWDVLITFAWNIKEKLKLAGWTVVNSSNGGSVSNSDVFPAAYNGTFNFWILLESPAGIITGGTGKVWLSIIVNTLTLSIELHHTLPTDATYAIPPTSLAKLVSGNFSYTLLVSASYKFQMVIWSNGTFWAGLAKFGADYLEAFVSVYPVSDINYSYPFAIAIKAVYQNTRWSESVLDNAAGWNFDGAVSSTGFRTMLMQGASGVVGYNLPATGDLANKHLDSKVYLYNGHTGSVGVIGKIGAEGYDFGITGCTSVVNSSVDANIPKRCLYGGVWLPTNAVITA